MFITRREMTSQQIKDHGEPPETHVTPERPKTHVTPERPETHVTPERPETHVTPERTPESVIEHPKPRDPEPIDLINPLKGYVGVPDESKHLNLSCSVCALVTGSGRMLSYKAGNEIDQADCVIRMNEGPVLGYEKHVGSKTTLRVMCFRSIYIAPINADIYKGNSTLLGWGPPRDMDAKTGKAYQKLTELQKSHPDMEVFKITEERMQYSDKVFEKESGRARSAYRTILFLLDAIFFLHSNRKFVSFLLVFSSFLSAMDGEVPQFYVEEVSERDLEALLRPWEAETEPEQQPEPEGAAENTTARFATLDGEQLDEIEGGRVEKTTEKSTRWGVKIFKAWLQARDKNTEFEELPETELSQLLRQFYAEVRKDDGTPYSKVQ
uniref:Uncharacterized protein n=2 Tax=Branchiostoma floridae TaxID=7739 RepID=C3ZKC5_BRAFL|eukprot:XP_002591013.1 hypothetical protein BRAFLDRAFT_119083 [Branchiostoma floridae]